MAKLTPENKGNHFTCFVACAFGRPDVDQKYKVIASVLKSIGVSAKRVDRLHFNSKIDGKIVDLMNSCDFGIADLTYARPSVYYEAGYIHGLGKQVVFTCRQDHFDSVDDYLRVHFDLRSFNIVGWKSDEKFERELKARVKATILPLQKIKTDLQEVKQQEHSFGQLSLIEKLKLIEEQAKQTFEEFGWIVYNAEAPGEYQKFIHENEMLGFRSRPREQKKRLIAFFKPSYTKQDLRDIWNHHRTRLLIAMHLPDLKSLKSNYEPKVEPSTRILCCLAKLSDSTFMAFHNNYSKVDSTKRIFYSERHSETVIVIDNIKSQEDFKKRLEGVLN
jgi:hypothetical protein